ncbi:MAG: DUF692 family multinuclear iron-containing protein [Anaerolineaceae bacterium]
MKLAVNASAQLQALLARDLVQVDLIKCPEWEGIVNDARQYAPVYIHFEIAIGNATVEKLDFEMIKRFLGSTATPHLNVHLAGNGLLHSDKYTDQVMLLDAWKADIEFIRKHLPDTIIVAETLPYLPSYSENRIANQSWIIRELLESMDINLLLDLSHIRITAAYEGMDYQALIEALPVERLRELHITGIKAYAGYLTDHFEMNADDLASAEWAIKQIKSSQWREPEIVSFEYGGFGDVFAWRSEEWVLREQVPALWRMIHAKN